MADRVYRDVAHYLTEQRERKSLSQELLAEKLASYSKIFEGIDGLTISRWERAAVSPNIERQVTLMEFFGDEPHLLLGNANYQLKQLPSLGAFHKWMQQNLLYNHVMGGHPYATDDEKNFDKNGADHEQFPLWISLVCRYNENLTRGRESWCKDHLQALATANASHTIFYCINEQLLGHVILVKVGDKTLELLLKGNMKDTELQPDQLVDTQSPGNLYVYSAYFGTRYICEDGLTHALQTFMESDNSAAMGVKARANFGVKLMELLLGEVIGKGEAITGHRDGARYNGKYLEHVAYLLRRKDLLSNPTILNLIRKTRP